MGAVIDGVSSDQFPDPRVQRLSREKELSSSVRACYLVKGIDHGRK
jgi:hypothetical protein